MASVTGTISQVNVSAGSGFTTVTVPADATGAVAFWSHFNNLGVAILTCDLNGTHVFDTQSEIPCKQPAADNTGVGVAVLDSLPGTGIQGFNWQWSDLDARDEGGGLFIVWIKDVDLTDLVRDVDTDTQSGSSTLNLTIDSALDDLVLAFGQSFFSDSDPALGGSLLVNNVHVNSEGYDVSEITATSPTTAVSMGPNSYPTLAVISLKTAPLWTLIQENSTDYADHATQIAFTGDVTIGDLLLVWHDHASSTPITALPTDSRGNVWQELVGDDTADEQDVRIWWAQAKDSGPCTVTLPTNTFATGRGVAQFRPPTAGTIVVDGTPQKVHVNTASGTDVGSLGPATVTQDESLAISVLGTDDGGSPNIVVGTGWTLINIHDLGPTASSDRVAGSYKNIDAGTVTALWSETTNGIFAEILLGVFKISTEVVVTDETPYRHNVTPLRWR